MNADSLWNLASAFLVLIRDMRSRDCQTPETLPTTASRTATWIKNGWAVGGERRDSSVKK